MTTPELMILGTADWNQPIATNQHYMTRELSSSYNSIFIESLGLRRPELNFRDVKRVLQRVLKKRSKTSVRTIPGNAQIFAPLVIPVHGRMVSNVNHHLLRQGLVKKWLMSDSQKIFWTYSPVTYGLEAQADIAVYHCVDLLGEFPGIDRDLIDRSERNLAAAGVQAIASSEVVLRHLRNQGFEQPILWPNVADVEAITNATRTVSAPRTAAAIFSGNITSKKVDFHLLNALLSADIEVHIAGPVAQGGGDAEHLLNDLIGSGAIYHGMLPLDGLSRLMATCSVGLIPYALNSYTEGVNPLKVYEYLAAGLSVVSTPVPSVGPREGHVFVESTASNFIRAVSDSITPASDETLLARLSLAEQNSWSQRGRQARQLIAKLLAAKK